MGITYTKEKKCPYCGQEPRNIDYAATAEEATEKLGFPIESKIVGKIYRCANPNCSNPNREKLFLVEE